MESPCLRLSVRAMMIGVAAVGVLLALIPSISRFAETYVWFGRCPILMGGVLNPPPVVEPRLGFAFIPTLSVIVALRKPSRRIVWAAFWSVCCLTFVVITSPRSRWSSGRTDLAG